MAATKKKNNKWKIFFEWLGIIGSGIAILGIPTGVALFINNKQHNMEMIELNQKHNLELQRQHDEFEEKLSILKDALEECKQQYRLLELEKRKSSNEK